jgi:hypothetical protein
MAQEVVRQGRNHILINQHHGAPEHQLQMILLNDVPNSEIGALVLTAKRTVDQPAGETKISTHVVLKPQPDDTVIDAQIATPGDRFLADARLPVAQAYVMPQDIAAIRDNISPWMADAAASFSQLVTTSDIMEKPPRAQEALLSALGTQLEAADRAVSRGRFDRGGR